MTAGASLFLVSACSTGEEFVAAFRRYADRNGVLFVPTAEPLSSGKRGRIAVTLKDGGVMLEGDAEVVSASKNPSVLYGRVGMTIKFTGPDELSKVVLGELEKARLALKPSAPSVMPRPTELPSDKRPTPPAPGGRIDAVNALAECIILGELADAVPAAVSGGGSGRYAVPQLLPLGGRTKSPTTPPSVRAKKLTQPPVTATRVPAASPDESTRNKAPSIPPAIPGLPGSKATSLGMAAIRTPAFPTAPPSTIHGVPQTPRTPAAPLIAPPPPVVETPIAVAPPPAPKLEMNETLRGTLPATPAAPIVAPSRPTLPAVEIGEPTDLSAMLPMLEGAATEQTNAQREPRTTTVGVAIAPRPPMVVEEPTPSGDWTMTPGANGPTITRTSRPDSKDAAQEIPKGPPTGDWMIALDPSRPDGWSEPSKVEKRPPGELPPGPPVSTVASAVPLDSNANLPQHAQEVPKGGPSIEIDPSLTGPATPIDEPAAPVAASLPQRPFVAPLLTPTSTPAVQISPEQHLAMLGIAPSPRALTDAGTGFFRDSGDIPRYPSESTSALPSSRKQLIVILASAAAAVAIGLVLVFSLGGDDKKADTAGSTATAGSGSSVSVSAGSATAPVATGSNAARAPAEGSGTEVAPSTAGSNAVVENTTAAVGSNAAPPSPPAPVATNDGSCEVKVSTVPAGADIFIAGESVGKTPKGLPLPCGVETKLSLRRTRYVTSNVTVKPSAEKPKPVNVSLARVTMVVKVSSVPAGATISVGTKSIGVTPTTVKLPAFEPSTLKISKPGFAAETHKVTPKQNNLAVHAVLKKTGKR